MKKIPRPVMATAPSYVGMPVSARTSAPVMTCAKSGSALVPTDWFDARLGFAHNGFVVGDAKGDLIDTTPGTRAWRPPS